MKLNLLRFSKQMPVKPPYRAIPDKKNPLKSSRSDFFTNTKKTESEHANTIIRSNSEAIVRKLIDHAKKGSPMAMRLCMERITPPIKSVPINHCDLPEVNSLTDCVEVQRSLINLVSKGDMLPHEAEFISSMVEKYMKTLEVYDIDKRLKALEESASELEQEKVDESFGQDQ